MGGDERSVRPGLVIGFGAMLAAIVVGKIHHAYTGDASVTTLVWSALAYAAIVSALLALRGGVPLSIRLRALMPPGRRAAAR